MNIDIRLAAVVAAVLTVFVLGCDTYEDPLPERDTLYYPIGVEMHPDGRFLYVVNSNFDLRFRDDQGGTVTVIDTETGEILDEASPYVPSFGAHIALDDEAETAWVSSRESNELTMLSIAEHGQGLFCEAEDGEQLADTRPCTTGRVPDTRSGTRIPQDPFGVAVDEVERVDEEDEELKSFDIVHLSHLVGSNVTSISFPDGAIAGASMRSAGLVEEGGTQLEIRPGTEEVWVAGRRSNRVDAFRPFVNARGEVEALVRAGSFRLSERDRSVDARGLAFGEDGDWLYVATRNPAALHLVGMEATEDGRPQVVNSIPLEHRPSQIEYHQGADGVDRLYIPSYRHGTVEVVEPHREAVVDTIDVGRSPYVMTTDPSPAHCTDPGERCQAYVSLFDAGPDGDSQCDDGAEQCGQVAVLDLDPASETYHTVIETFE